MAKREPSIIEAVVGLTLMGVLFYACVKPGEDDTERNRTGAARTTVRASPEAEQVARQSFMRVCARQGYSEDACAKCWAEGGSSCN
jgi:hypothetical protein